MNTFSRNSLRSLSVLTAFLVAALFGLLAATAIHHALHRAANDEAAKLTAASAGIATAMVDGAIARRSTDMASFASLLEGSGMWKDQARLRAWLEKVQADYEGYSWLGLADAQGRVALATGGLAQGADVSQRTWFKGGSQRTFQGDLHAAILLEKSLPPLPGGEPWRFIDVSTPIHTADGQLAGVLAAHLSWPWLRERLQPVQAALPDGAELWLVGTDNRPRVGGPESAPALTLKAIELAREGKIGARIETWPDGRRYVTAYAPNRGRDDFKGFGWVTLVRTPADVLPAEAMVQWRTLLAVVVAGVILVTFAAWLASTIWLRPLRLFTSRLAKMREGQVPPELPRRAPQEFHELNHAVLRLVDRLDQKEAAVRRALEDVQHSFRSVGSSIPGVLSTFEITRESGLQFTFISDSCELYYGIPAEVLMAKPHLWASALPSADVKALEELFVPQQGHSTRLFNRMIHARGGDGVERALHVTVIRRDDPHRAVFDTITLDVSELVAARADAERANRAKSDFLATMSHELRTPLNAILGFAQVLEGTLSDPEQRQQVRYIRETGQTLTSILNDVLDIAKIEAGKFDLDPQPFRMEQVLDSCSSIFRVVGQDKGVAFDIEAPADLPPLVGDPVRLRQILHNLLSNAFKFTAQGQVSLSLQVHDMEQADETRRTIGLCIRVKDTGVGMTDEQLKRVFERFEQAERSTANRFGGTGLGLAIVKALVDKMAGTIEVSSRYGDGTEFALYIPFDIAVDDETTPYKAAASQPDAPLHVLVVDDFHVNRHVLRALLEKRGHRVSEAEDGVQALDRVAQLRPDLVLMDLDMPNMDGLEATRRIRALADEAGGLTPVYALTGKAFAEDIERARQAGMHGHLAKPVQLDDLVRVLRAVAPSPASLA